MKLKFRSKFNHGYLHSAVWKALYSFKIKRDQEARQPIFLSKKMRSLRSSKCLKTVELTFTAQKLNTCSPWTACSLFDWKYLFWVNLIQKLKIISLSWNFVPRLIQICRIPWWCSLFLFSTGNTVLGKFGKKKKRKLSVCAEISH